MPQIPASAKRYAQAVFEIARERDQFDAWLNELDQARLLMENREAAAVLTSPAVPGEERHRLLDRLTPGLSAPSRRLLHLLLERDRLELLPGVVQELRRRINEHRGIQTADVTSAIPLDKELEGVIARRLSELTGKTVVVEHQVDPSLIGGFVARIGDQLYDFSVRGKLDRLRDRLAAR